MSSNVQDRFCAIHCLICCSVVLDEQRFFSFVCKERKCFPCARLHHRSMAPPFQIYKSQLCFQLRVTYQIPFTLCTWAHKSWFLQGHCSSISSTCVSLCITIISFVLHTCITCISIFFLCALCTFLYVRSCDIATVLSVSLEVHCGCCIAYSKGKAVSVEGFCILTTHGISFQPAEVTGVPYVLTPVCINHHHSNGKLSAVLRGVNGEARKLCVPVITPAVWANKPKLYLPQRHYSAREKL